MAIYIAFRVSIIMPCFDIPLGPSVLAAIKSHGSATLARFITKSLQPVGGSASCDPCYAIMPGHRLITIRIVETAVRSRHHGTTILELDMPP